jgi:hypothetical protein
MSEYQKRLESLAQNWQQDEKNPKHLLQDRSLIAARCWAMADSNKASELSKEFVETSFQASGGEDAWTKRMSEREWCDRCYQKSKVENLTICLKCNGFFCFNCECNYNCNWGYVG